LSPPAVFGKITRSSVKKSREIGGSAERIAVVLLILVLSFIADGNKITA
jgi:hypothetical protein